MNPRVLELLKNPKNIQSGDLGLLKEEIHAFPYVQNIRALHLFGVHLYDKENYQKELSTTAAYTTDKKILYQLINGKIRQESKSEAQEEKESPKTTEKPVKYTYKKQVFPIKREESSEMSQNQYEAAASMIPPAQEIRHVVVNGERNRILFEGEENFLDDKNSETIDLESTLESGVLITQKAAPVAEDPKEEIIHEQNEEESKQLEDAEAGVEFTPELIVDEEKIDSQAEENQIDKDDHVSFHEIEEILPEVTAAAEEEIVSAETEQDFTIAAEDQNEEPHAEISFHGMDEFLPDVKIQGNNDDIAATSEVSRPNVNKHEEEMRRLIEEVEKKMKEAQVVPKIENKEPETVDHEISFAETQNFHFWSTEKEETKAGESVPEQVEDTTIHSVITEEKEAEEETKEQEISAEDTPVWKPMSLESNLPDSLINKENTTPVSHIKTIENEIITPVGSINKQEEETVVQTAEEPSMEVQTIAEEIPQSAEEKVEEVERSEPVVENSIPKEEVPVMNVSFFGTDISSLAVEKKEKHNPENTSVQQHQSENAKQTQLDSNVPGFINTWQSWLKIDRPVEEVVEKEEAPVQEKVIEAFIENNPRISQLRDESTYVVKEKNDDISHLMTETLANLYFEQKLYSKAIKAFEILIKKTPAKKEHFQSKIQEIKDFRSKG